MNAVDIFVTVLSGLAALIALAAKLYSTFKSLINERKYADIFSAVADGMKFAETLVGLSGEEKKKLVMTKASEEAERLGIKDFDAERVSRLIEMLIDISKTVNAK